MGKNNFFSCNNCGAIFNKWQGQCSECHSWSSIVEEISQSNISKKLTVKQSSSSVNLSKLNDISQNFSRIDSNISEFNRLLGGGIVNGSAILISGEPGIGKSTIILQLANELAQNNLPSIYISGEEALSQIKLRANRLMINNEKISLANLTSLAELLDMIKRETPNMVVIDSIQTLFFDKLDSPPGSVSQVRVCSHELIQLCKKLNITLVIIGHITKEGQIAGPKILEHMVDVVLSFEGDNSGQYRIIRATKNRFGTTNELALFEMCHSGLKQVVNPSEIFLSKDDSNNDKKGSCVFPSVEGSRTILLEVQALVVDSFLATPRRSTLGWDLNRLAMIIAVLNAKINLNLSNKEVYLNFVGGLKVTEPAADLSVIAALISAAKNLHIPNDTILFGEVGLSGEIRNVSFTANRLIEAEKLGFKQAIIPAQRKKIKTKLQVTEISHINKLNNLLF